MTHFAIRFAEPVANISPPISFKCRVTRYALDGRPILAEFEVALADGTRDRFTKTSSFEIETMRNRLTRILAKRSR